jgi:NADH:ubiquinone oxidoreductase subunit 6 (subunit J)
LRRNGRQMPMPPLDEITNTEALGQVLYTDYVFFFQRPAWCCWSR